MESVIEMAKKCYVPEACNENIQRIGLICKNIMGPCAWDLDGSACVKVFNTKNMLWFREVHSWMLDVKVFLNCN